MFSIDIAIIALYLLATLGIGIYRGLSVRNMRDFAIADRKYSTPVLVATIAATATGGGSTLGMTEQVYAVGIIFVLVTFGETLYKILIAQFIAPRMGQFANMISVGDIMNKFYGKPGRIITGIAGALLSIGMVGGQVFAIGYLFQWLGMPPLWGILIGASIVVIYSTFGGIKAVTATDVIQFAVLIITIPMVCNVALNNVGGYKALFAAIPDSHLTLAPNPSKPFEYITYFILMSIPFLNPAVMQRMLMAKDPAQIRKSMLITAGIEAPFFVIVGIIGLCVLVMYPDLESNRIALPFLIDTILPVGIKGLAIAGMLAVIMSTADSYLNTAAVALVHDVIKPLSSGLNAKTELRITRVATFAIGGLAIFSALNFSSITETIFSSLGYWGPTILVPLLCGIFGFVPSRACFYLSITLGLGVYFTIKFLKAQQIIVNDLGIGTLVPSILACILVYTVYYQIRKRTQKQPSLAPKRHTVSRFATYLSNVTTFLRKLGKFSNIANFSTQRVESYGAYYMPFGIFAVINYIIPYFMWSYSALGHHEIALTLRFTAGLLCFFLVMKDHWPKALRQYLPLYWHGTLLFCLPFLTTYMLLDSQASIDWLFNLALALFLLAILVDWLSFMIILPLGTLLGYIFYLSIGGPSYIPLDTETLYWTVYMVLFAIAIGLIFSRNRENIEREKINTARTLGAAIAHEIRTPLSSLNMQAELLKAYLPPLLDFYNKNKEKEDSLIPKDHQDKLSELADNQRATIRRAFLIIDMLLNNIRSLNESLNTEILDARTAVEEAVDAFPFRNNEVTRVNISQDPSFPISVDPLIFRQVLHNLIKNALHFTHDKDSPSISIKFESTPYVNVLHFQDNGNGIKQSLLPHIFDPFYSRRKHGTGIGLSFCKMAMKKLGGDITCSSKKNEYTHFILSFPKPETIEAST